MAHTIKELMDYLQLNIEDGKAPFDKRDKTSVSDILRRIKFGLKMKKYLELVEDISSNNRRINQLTAQTRILLPVRESRRRVPYSEKGRQYAYSLFYVLQSRIVGSCDLRHTASLHLKPIKPLSTGKHRALGAERLRIVFHHQSSDNSRVVSSWTAEEAEVNPLDHDDDDFCLSDDASVPAPRSSVRFAPQRVPAYAHDHQGNLQEIHDLCASLGLLRISQATFDICFGYLSVTRHHHRHELYRPSKPAFCTEGSSTITLAHVLSGRSGHSLGETDKKFLAHALASGMLRLHNTPWLGQQWGRNDVVIFRRGAGLATSHPFISADISPSGALTPFTPMAFEYFQPCRLIREQTVFALGILLIELALACPFDTLIRPEDLNVDGTKHEMTDFVAADRLIADVYSAAGERYGDVVRRCVRCDFDQKNSSLMDAEFRKKVYYGVVAELQLEVDDILQLSYM